jgi:hypothetical protein
MIVGKIAHVIGDYLMVLFDQVTGVQTIVLMGTEITALAFRVKV